MTDFPRMTYSIVEFCQIFGVGRSYVYEAIAAGDLEARKAGKKTLITVESAQRWFDSLPAAEVKPVARKRVEHEPFYDGLSTRAANALKSMKITTIDALKQETDFDLLMHRSIGRGTLREIRAWQDAHVEGAGHDG